MSESEEFQSRDRLNGSLFDEDGLPWTSRIQWGLLLVWVGAIFIVFAPMVGLYLGIWLISKRRSSLPLVLYSALLVLFAALIAIPFPAHGPLSGAGTFLDALVVVLWLMSGFMLRRAVMAYYSDREGTPLPLSPLFTALFGPWYISGHLRANFPLNGGGRTGSGVLKLVN